MKNFFHKLWLRIRAIFIKPVSLQRKSKSKGRQYEDMDGQYKTINALLKDLDRVFNILQKLHPQKSSVQRLIRRFGPYVPDFRKYLASPKAVLNRSTLDGFKSYGLPAHMIMYWPKTQWNTEGMTHEFLEQYFCAMKVKHMGVIPIRKDCVLYDVTMVYMLKKKPAEFSCLVEVNKKTGQFRAIKTPFKETHYFPVRRNRKQRGRTTHYETIVWKYPSIPTEDPEHIKNPKMHIEEMFALSYNITMLREYGVNIIVKKDGTRATFTVPQDRWKYFFQSRIKAKTPQGHTKPIFHSVMAHTRRIGALNALVKTHYRGIRHFFWKGFEINIVMQGKHGLAQASFGAEALSVEEGTGPIEGFVDITDRNIATRINAAFEGR